VTALNAIRLQKLLLSYISIIATVPPTTPAKPPVFDRAQIGGLLFSREIDGYTNPPKTYERRTIRQ
jgi:hypothetical protein